MTYVQPTLEHLDRAVMRADVALTNAAPEERSAAEVEALGARLAVARRMIMNSTSNDPEGVRLAVGVSEWLRVYGATIGPVGVQALSDFLRRPSEARNATSLAVRDAA